MLSIFSTKKKANTYRKVNVLNLKPNDTCFYGGHSSPFTVVEAECSNSGVYFVEIKNEKGKKYLFTDNTTVLIEVND